MNAQSKSVLTMGELLWDMLPDGKKPGGAPANFVYHAAQNGVEATAVTAVGDDELGRELVQLLTERGVNVAAQTNEYATGTTAVSLDENGIPPTMWCEIAHGTTSPSPTRCASWSKTPMPSATAVSRPVNRTAPVMRSTR